MKKLRKISALLICLLFCGLTAANAAEAQTSGSTLYPIDVQTISEGGAHQIVKSYVLTAEQSPADIPADSFERDGRLYTLTDITARRDHQTDTRAHTEAVEIQADTNDLDKITQQLPPTMEYESEDGYCGLLTLNEQSVTSKAAGYKSSSYTVSATREYPHLSTNDLSLIPKSISDSGRTLELDGVTWEAQHTVNVDYAELPDSYCAIATYTAKATRSVVTGYVATAEYSGAITKVISDNTICTAIFTGTAIVPELPAQNPASYLPVIVGIALAAALLTGFGVYVATRRHWRKQIKIMLKGAGAL